MAKRPNSEQVNNYLLSHITLLPPDSLVEAAASAFGITRQAIHKRLKKLEADGHLTSEGRTRAKKYYPVWLGEITKHYTMTPDLAEDKILRQDFTPGFPDLKVEVRHIVEYGFSEMVNNVIDHSEGKELIVDLRWTKAIISLSVQDDGVGIFSKIRREKGLEDERHALLELSKGKLTTDPVHHTGQGIFFTSRVFDEFNILSGGLFFKHSEYSGDWLIQDDETEGGTRIDMLIMRDTNRTLKEVFDKYSADDEDLSFSMTRVPVSLARYGDELLVSRSQARRLLARFDAFRSVVLDFKGVAQIGQAFADEIFRVFRNTHSSVTVSYVNAEPEVERMIARAFSDAEQ